MKNLKSFKFRLLVSLGVIISLACSLLTYVSISKTVDVACDVFAKSGLSVIKKAKYLVDGDDIARLAKNNDEKDPAYEKIRKALFDIKSEESCRFLYTMVPVKGKIFKYVVDGSANMNDTENFSPIGTEEDITSYGSHPFDCINKNTIIVSGLEYQSQWGWAVTIYAPIETSRGEVIGFIGCDFDADFLSEMITQQKSSMWLICILFLVICLVFVYLVSIPFFRALKNVSNAMNSIAGSEGDLRTVLPVKSDDEVSILAKSCNSVITKVRDIVDKIKESINSLSNSSLELNQSTRTAKDSFINATKSIEDIGHVAKKQDECMDNVYNGIQKVWSEIENLDTKLGEESVALEKSSNAVETIANSIASVDSSVEKISLEYTDLVVDSNNGRRLQQDVIKKVNVIVAQSKNLTEANLIINDIAERTNLLAMNAAIEAAHAGALGKGFAVVAGEIRHLAETSSAQSKAIENLLTGINGAISEIVKSSGDSEKAFDGIAGRIEKIDNMMQKVLSGMNEQTSGVKEILGTVKVLNDNSDSIASASKAMKDESKLAFSGIDTLRTCTKDVLEKTDNISSQISKMEKLSLISMETAQKNQTISDTVANLVNSFKTK